MIDTFGKKDNWVSYFIEEEECCVDMEEVVQFFSSPAESYYVIRGWGEEHYCPPEVINEIRKFKKQ